MWRLQGLWRLRRLRRLVGRRRRLLPVVGRLRLLLGRAFVARHAVGLSVGGGNLCSTRVVVSVIRGRCPFPSLPWFALAASAHWSWGSHMLQKATEQASCAEDDLAEAINLIWMLDAAVRGFAFDPDSPNGRAAAGMASTFEQVVEKLKGVGEQIPGAGARGNPSSP
jgi:hypothetical protein